MSELTVGNGLLSKEPVEKLNYQLKNIDVGPIIKPGITRPALWRFMINKDDNAAKIFQNIGGLIDILSRPVSLVDDHNFELEKPIEVSTRTTSMEKAIKSFFESIKAPLDSLLEVLRKNSKTLKRKVTET